MRRVWNVWVGILGNTILWIFKIGHPRNGYEYPYKIEPPQTGCAWSSASSAAWVRMINADCEYSFSFASSRGTENLTSRLYFPFRVDALASSGFPAIGFNRCARGRKKQLSSPDRTSSNSLRASSGLFIRAYSFPSS